MEEIGLGEKGHGVMCVEDYNSAHKSHGSVAMEAIMVFFQQPLPWVLFVLGMLFLAGWIVANPTTSYKEINVVEKGICHTCSMG